MPKSVTVPLEAPVLEALDRAAEQRGRSRADIIAEAIRDYLETQRSYWNSFVSVRALAL